MGVKMENGLNGMIMDRRRKKKLGRMVKQMAYGLHGGKMDKSGNASNGIWGKTLGG
jgi:hypothetical protein